jgi:hypothetical protein
MMQNQPNVRAHFRRLTPIPGRPTYTTMKNMKKELLYNVTQVFTTNGNGTDGYHRVLETLVNYNVLIAPNQWFDQGPPAALRQ